MVKGNGSQFVEGGLAPKSKSDFLAVILQQTVLFWWKWLIFSVTDSFEIPQFLPASQEWKAVGAGWLHCWDAVWEAGWALWAVHHWYLLLTEDMRAAAPGSSCQAAPALGRAVCCQLQVRWRCPPAAGQQGPEHQPWKPFFANCALSVINQKDVFQ